MDKYVVLKDVKAYVKKHPLLNRTQKKVQVSTTSEGDVVYVSNMKDVNRELKKSKKKLIKTLELLLYKNYMDII